MFSIETRALGKSGCKWHPHKREIMFGGVRARERERGKKGVDDALIMRLIGSANKK